MSTRVGTEPDQPLDLHDSEASRASGEGLSWTRVDGAAPRYGSEGWGFESLRAAGPKMTRPEAPHRHRAGPSSLVRWAVCTQRCTPSPSSPPGWRPDRPWSCSSGAARSADMRSLLQRSGVTQASVWAAVDAGESLRGEVCCRCSIARCNEGDNVRAAPSASFVQSRNREGGTDSTASPNDAVRAEVRDVTCVMHRGDAQQCPFLVTRTENSSLGEELFPHVRRA